MVHPAAGREADAFLRLCPSRDLMARLGEKWTALALVALDGGPQRFGALLRRLEGVSQKMLSQTLKGLERDGLLTRTVRATRPLQVEYALTPAAAELVPIMAALKAWAERNLAAVAASWSRHDRRAARAMGGPLRNRP
jgi:DNA-binding HxlR family transcriptional regulator